MFGEQEEDIEQGGKELDKMLRLIVPLDRNVDSDPVSRTHLPSCLSALVGEAKMRIWMQKVNEASPHTLPQQAPILTELLLDNSWVVSLKIT